MLIILFSFLIQLIETNIDNEIRETQHYQTQIKLDNLWELVGKNYIKNDKSSNNKRYLELEEIEKNWKYYSEGKEYLSNWQRDVLYDGISKSRIWIFIVGSILTIFHICSKYGNYYSYCLFGIVDNYKIYFTLHK